MEDMIQNRLKIIKDLREELASLKESYQDMLEEDPVYQEIQEKNEEIREERKENKIRLMNNASYTQAEEEIKELRRDMREHKEVLSQELVEYYKKSGEMQITDSEGNVKKMKFSVRLVNS